MIRAEWSPARRCRNVYLLDVRDRIWGRSSRIATTITRFQKFAGYRLIYRPRLRVLRNKIRAAGDHPDLARIGLEGSFMLEALLDFDPKRAHIGAG